MEVNKMLEQLNSATNWYEVNEFNGLCDKAKVYFLIGLCRVTMQGL